MNFVDVDDGVEAEEILDDNQIMEGNMSTANDEDQDEINEEKFEPILFIRRIECC